MCANLGRYTLILYLIHSVRSQGPFQLTLSSNPVYSGDSVTLTVSYGSGVLVQVTVDAFNATLKKGSLSYVLSPLSSNGTGVFAGQTFTGWQNYPTSAKNISVTLTATPSFELDYNCSIKVLYNSNFYDGTCAFASLQVRVLPSPPTFVPKATTFNQSDTASISCESLNGKPAANISLTVSMPNGTTVTSRGISSSFIVVPSPSIDWHNATATCNVTNHNFPNMTVTTSVMINHIRSTAIHDIIISANESGVTLNCSAYVRSYPGVLYSWRTLIAADVVISSDPSNAFFHVRQGQSGSFNCTATNIITMKNVTIVFIVSIMSSPTNGPLSDEYTQKEKPLWVIGLVLGYITVVTIAIVLVVLCKRGHFSKGNKERCVTHSITDHRSNNGNFPGAPSSEQRNYANTYAPSIDRNYESLNAQPTNEPTYAQLSGVHRLDDVAAYETF